ncbi:related to CAC2 - component of the chromatin assembly complex [Melanopsichium pennsylvanicum]|uniref:Related to CAC2 - component of the chromatin assembly complex n=2 Tax=Melanopsichium pennsylvanicum TaxID=63383 RepID=A0AAJ4XKI2_9BASI|nr:wd40 repeat-like protein [Melanopsichium pennsylvanicum 4]SNX83471.1 related to CAC2 - component of the chromatin assembly complex [Melanopsichium pennsylvanicum]
MVRSVTFEIRWHDTQPIYSCSFQPIPANHLRRVLDHNMGQAAGMAPGKGLSELDSSTAAAMTSTASTHASSSTPVASSSKLSHPPIMAGGQSWRLATAGGDNNARIWMVHPNIPSPAAMASAAAVSGSAIVAPHPPRVEYLATLQRHSGVVNVVRFCPKGELLATAGDDGNVLFWVPSDRSKPSFGDVTSTLEGESQFEKEFWRVKLMCRATQQELYDMAWSPNGETLAVGGTDFVARIINVQDGHVIREISEHNHYVQGIAWDPLNEFLATQSSDRTVHVHGLQTRRHDRERDGNANGSSVDASSSQLVSRNAKLDLHRRNGSSGGLVWDQHHSKPGLPRRTSSHASQASDGEGARESFVASLRGRSKRSSTPIDPSHTNTAVARASTPSAAVPSAASASSAAAGVAAARASTPTPAVSVPPSPFPTNSAAVATHAMNPPQTTPSRRSSFSGSNFDVGSPPTSTASLAPGSNFAASHGIKTGTNAVEHGLTVASGAAASDAGRRGGSVSRSASRTRSIRSPSPIPPLPAIRAPPSPKQRMQAAAASGLGGPLAKASMRLYGDENFSGFFRRLSFSPDGGLLVTPSGLFDPPPPPASPTVHLSPRKSPATANAAPAGGTSVSPQAGPANKSAVYLYARGNLARSNAPIAVLPGHKTATLVVRFSPVLYELRKTPRATGAEDDEGIAPHPTIPLEAGKQKTVSLARTDAPAAALSPSLGSTAGASASPSQALAQVVRSDARSPPRGISVIGLPYRMVYAVATQDSVWIYDTQQTGPICCFSNMHYASFTDLTWSPDGQTLMMSSTDGYCSVVVFDYAELGIPYPFSAQPALKAPAPGVPAPAHIAEGKSTGSAPNTPKMASPAMLAPAPAPALGSAAEAYASAIAASASGTSGLGLAVAPTPPSQGKQVSPPVPTSNEGEAPKKKRRVALTLERPLGS